MVERMCELCLDIELDRVLKSSWKSLERLGLGTGVPNTSRGQPHTMSELLRKLAVHIRNAPSPDIHVVAGQALTEDDPIQLASAEPTKGSARLVSSCIDAVSVGHPENGRFAFFMDGMERQRIVLYCSMIPVVYGYVAAVVRQRGADKRMRTHGGRATANEALYFPRRLVEMGFGGLDIVDIDNGEDGLEGHPKIIAEAAKKKVSNVRNRMESQITSSWLAEFAGRDEWLLVDGSLTGDYSSYESPHIVGVVKSHQTQYFDMEEQRKILALKAGERSGVFTPLDRRRPEVYSWYLRLRPNVGQDVYFGLIRVEAAKCQRTLDMADEISRWLMAERSPLSLPDFRWDRMIYPIRDCETYLKSLAPTRTVLEASMFGLGSTVGL